jgi:hypothetical protein
VLDAIAEALDEELIARAVEKALQKLRAAPERARDRRATLTAEATLLEARMRHLVDEIGRGYATDTLRAELQAGEQHQRALAAELAARSRKPTDATLDAKRLRRELRQRAADVRTLLGADIPRARQILQRLLVGRRSCEAFDEPGRRGYRVRVTGSYAEILPAGIPTPQVVTPAGFEPVGAVQLFGIIKAA